MQNLLLALLFTLAALASATAPTSSLGYPVFGTKRFARANLLPPNEYGSSLSMPMYTQPISQQQQQQQQQYYDNTPQQYLPLPSYSGVSDYYDDTGYYGAGSYYYLPPVVHRRHQRHERYPSYGMPTYRGEYKPTPYYYAHAPSYSYSDDRESNNPLDDLHEEMLQEDERERARDYLPIGQEQWYESPAASRHIPDSTFLRNLIMYNQQMSSLRSKQQQQLDSTEEYDEYDDVEPEYYDALPSYNDQQQLRPLNYNSFINPYGGNNVPAAPHPSSSRNTFSMINNLRNSMAKNAVEDDEEVHELKSLIHQQKNSRLQQQQQPQVQTPSPMQDIKQQQQRSLIPHEYPQYTNEGTDSYQRDAPQYGSNSYDYENEYDDSWSHWDRKRNVQPKKVSIATVPAAILAPLPVTTTTTASALTTTEKPKVEIIHGHNGQKEVVLPRPAAPVRNPFAGMNIAGLQKQHPQQQAQQPAMVANMVKPAKAGSVYDTIKKIISMQHNLEDADLTKQLDSQKHQGSARLKKRFVATAESLVQQLDGLKRTA